MTAPLRERLLAQCDSGHRTLGGGTISIDGISTSYGGKPVYVLCNPDGPDAVAAIDELVAALRPFAAAADVAERTMLDMEPETIGIWHRNANCNLMSITLVDLLRVRAILAEHGVRP